MNLKLGILLLLTYMLNTACDTNTPTPTYASYDDYPVYNGDDLGLTFTPDRSTFKVWSPAVEAMQVIFYEKGAGGEATRRTAMTRDASGVWTAVFDENLEGTFYAFQATDKGQQLNEVPDPYVSAVGVNGKRGQVVDFAKTNPEGWSADEKPALKAKSDIIVWEVHVRDLSIHESSGIQNKGKFLGLTETGTRSPSGEKTGLDHIKDLGVTHVHLLPSYDYYTVDESRLDEPQFNWGYDPQNYNVPEGSYSTDPYDGATRVREFKQMVKTLHDNGLRVVMDVVYNHTGITEDSNFEQTVPGYYYRQREDGTFSDASGCGNETASDRPMFRKFMIESMKHWMQEYHVDGFRIDLMAIHDIETLNQLSKELHDIDPTVFIYGEGWTAGDSPLPVERRALKAHTRQLDRIAAFSDDVRDGLKGSVFNHEDRGFVSGKAGTEESIKFGIIGSTEHPQIDYEKVNYSNEPWANEPTQTMTYFSCHDNHTMWDRLLNSNPDDSEAERIKMHQLAGVIVLTSQGVPFLHAGTELLRTKFGEENSYKSPDSINQFVWERKTEYKNVYDFYKNLIALRKNHPAFRMGSTALLKKHLEFMEMPDSLLVGYQLKDNANGDEWKDIVVLLNGNADAKQVDLPQGNWLVVLRCAEIAEGGMATATRRVEVPGRSAVILARNME
ncbi:MAG: type I pullulanase [Saprospiraceae bacterium]